MNLNWIDWSVVGGMILLIIFIALYAKRYNRSVADFLAANRCAGPYLLAISETIAGAGAIVYLAHFEMYYNSGFSPFWWALMGLPVGQFIALSGWIIYRYRQSRVMTMAQFFEIRYSRRFRIFMGVLAFLSGIVNFGIFPALAGRFFLYFCGFPHSFTFLGITFSTFAVIMAVILGMALFFTFIGGQIAVMITDFTQGLFTNIAMVIILIILFMQFDFARIDEVFSLPENAHLANPMIGQQSKDFNIWFFIISVIGSFYSYMAWQGNQGYNCAARSPHAARFGKILGGWRYKAMWVITLIIPIYALIVMKSPEYSQIADEVNKELAGVQFGKLRDQLISPVVLTKLMPAGVVGAFCSLILAAFISNFDTYLHTWGSMFIQDVVLPLRGKPFEQKQHIFLLKLSIVGVALFIFIFSLLIKPTQHIYMYLYVTGAIFTGGAGSAIIGGFYWKKGTTPAAWTAMFLGSSIAVFGVVIHQIKPGFPINGTWFWFIAIVTSTFSYVLVSLLTYKKDFNLDKTLHRGKYAIKDEQQENHGKKTSGILKKLGLSEEFTTIEKVIYLGTLIWTFGWFSIFVIGTAYALIFGISTESWISFWKGVIVFTFVLAIVISVWFTIGGFFDLKALFVKLNKTEVNEFDDGLVVGDHNLEDEVLLEDKDNA